jgi:hypothetical protein
LNKAVKLDLSLAHRIGAKPYGSNNDLVSIRMICRKVRRGSRN